MKPGNGSYFVSVLVGLTIVGLMFGGSMMLLVFRPDLVRTAWASLAVEVREAESSSTESGGLGSTSALASVVGDTNSVMLFESEEPEPEPLSDAEIAAWLDDLGGHPEDPSLPAGILGSSDSVLLAANPLEVKALLQDPDVNEFLSRMKAEPRFLFAAGRAAMFHGYGTLAKGLLEEASLNGSGPASAYLADPSFGASREHATRLYEKAISLRFAPAVEWLAELQLNEDTEEVLEPEEPVFESPELPATPKRPFDFKTFKQEAIVRALHSGDLAALDRVGPRNVMLYLGGLQEGLMDPSVLIHLSPEGGRAFFDMLEPTLHASIAMATLSDGQIMDEQMNVAGGMLKTFVEEYGGIGRGRATPGMSWGDAMKEIQRDTAKALAKTAAPAVAYDALLAQAKHDAFSLALYADGAVDDVSRVIDGMKAYVAHRASKGSQGR